MVQETSDEVRVLCRSDGARDQTVTALEIEGLYYPVASVESDRYSGAAMSGRPVTREVLVRLDDGRRYRLWRVVPDGEWAAERAVR